MAIRYNAQLNIGNEALQTGPTITVNEDLRAAEDRQLARWIHYNNPLIPEQVAAEVLSHFCEAALALMSQGFSIPLKYNGVTMVRIYPDMHVKGGNITEQQALALDPTLTVLSPDVPPQKIAQLVRRVGVDVKVHATARKEFSDLLQRQFGGVEVELGEVTVRDVVRRKK